MKKSDQILLGIYRRWPRLDDHFTINSTELAWVLHHGVHCWKTKKGWNKIEYPAVEKTGDDLPPNSIAIDHPVHHSKPQINTCSRLTAAPTLWSGSNRG